MKTVSSIRFLADVLRVNEDRRPHHVNLLAEHLNHQLTGDAIDWPDVCWLAGRHLVTPSLAARLRAPGLWDSVPAEVGEYLETIRALNQARNQTHAQALVDLARALSQLGVEPLLLKGANALLPDAYPGAEDRMLGDLDLWLPESAHPAATAALLESGYRIAEVSWQFMLLRDRHAHHHGIPLLHETQPVKVELHRRLVQNRKDDELLAKHLTARQVALAPGVTVKVPDIATRLRHNFLHAQINDRQARKRRLNLRQLLEFAWLSETLGPDEAGALLDGLQTRHHRRFLEYCALAEHWLGLPYPESLPRSPYQNRELWLTQRTAKSRAWAQGFHLYDTALRFPRRILGLGVRAFYDPGYFPAKAKVLLNR